MAYAAQSFAVFQENPIDVVLRARYVCVQLVPISVIIGAFAPGTRRSWAVIPLWTYIASGAAAGRQSHQSFLNGPTYIFDTLVA